MIVKVAAILASLLAVSTTLGGEPAAEGLTLDPGNAITRIAFGSCHDMKVPKLTIPLVGKRLDIWDAIRGTKPDVMVMLGDNVYAKTTDMEVMWGEYAKLGADEGFKRLRASVPILATWDDNDYGYSDVGTEYPKKSQSQAIFLEFFGVPKTSPRWGREGVYDAGVVGPLGRRVQFILLDTRYFRSPLVKRAAGEPAPPVDRAGPYVPTRDTTTTLLGEAQWKWLEQQLREPAEVRILGSSIQVVAEEHGYEKWANFPHERERLFRLIRETGAKNVVILSGDRHHAEISRLDDAVGYPLYDVTSSSLNKPRMFTIEANRHRVGEMYFQSNFGLITINWEAKPAKMLLEIRNSSGEPVLSQQMMIAN